MLSRRRFLASLAAGVAGVRLHAVRPAAPALPVTDWSPGHAYSLALRTGVEVTGQSLPRNRRNPAPELDWSAAGRLLARRHPSLRRHFVFEYYPWYGRDPWRHWNQWDRQPPTDIAATSVPRLGPYDSRDITVLEQHARWIAESGVGAINVSWWGRDSFEDRAVHLLMDVMRDHDLKVTFHLEPYRQDRADSYGPDVLYLLKEYGERRHWDALLILTDADGREGPVFKSFATILPRETVDCLGRVAPVRLWVPDETWRRETDTLRETLRRDFDHVRLLADSSNMGRVRAAGFDGIAIYDNYVRPGTWPALAQACRSFGLLFSFNANAGFDGIEPRDEQGPCHTPPVFEPPAPPLNWTSAEDRERARMLAQRRMAESLRTTIALQTAGALPNFNDGFFLTYINSFNEWHEGTAFEPAKSYGELTPAERAVGYHNPNDGHYRLQALSALLQPIVSPERQPLAADSRVPA